MLDHRVIETTEVGAGREITAAKALASHVAAAATLSKAHYCIKCISIARNGP